MKKTGNALWIIGGICIVAFTVYEFYHQFSINSLNSSRSIKIRAVIIDEKNFMGNQPVDPQFSYS